MAIDLKEKLGTAVDALGSTEAGGLASGSTVLGATAYNNTIGGGGGDGYPRAYITLIPGGVFGSAPTVPSSVDVWFLRSLDAGTTYEGGSTGAPGVVPARAPDVSIPLIASTVAADNTVTVGPVTLPGCLIKFLGRNTGSAQTLPAGTVIKLMPATDEGV